MIFRVQWGQKSPKSGIMCLTKMYPGPCKGCTCLTFLHSAFSNVSSNYQRQRMHNHIGCICLTFLRCGFSNGSSKCLPGRMHSDTGCICLAFHHCVLSNGSSKN